MANPSKPADWMRRAIQVARRGFPAPNPRVGCVLVKDGSIVGEGAHLMAGSAHAEVNALRQAGDLARGATAYVTLEPCHHTGRTGPCTAALVAAGVAKVVYAVSDPNPQASGGAAWLRSQGVDVEQGLLGAEARAVNRRWLIAMERQRPFVAVKAAISLDGKIALPSGESQWITGEAARRLGRKLRAELGAVLVGRATVEADHPQLTARTRGARREPTRIALDPQGKLDLSDYDGPPWIQICGEGDSRGDLRAPLVDGQLNLEHVLRGLFEREVTALLVEGGGTTIARFLEADLVDELHLFVAPKVLGAGRTWTEGFAIESLECAPNFSIAATRLIGEDLYIRLERA